MKILIKQWYPASFLLVKMVVNTSLLTKIIKPFCIMLSKIGWYAKSFGETKYMYILIKEDKLLWKV